MGDGVDSTYGTFERSGLPQSVRSPSQEQYTTHHGDILYDCEFEFITITTKKVLNVLRLLKRPNGAPDCIPFLQKNFNDMDCEKPICSSNQNLVSWSDNWHDPRSS